MANQSSQVYISGIGISLGTEKISVDNILNTFTDEDLYDPVTMHRMDRANIKKRAGTKVLHRFSKDEEALENASCLAIRQALDNSGFNLKDVSYFSFATASPTAKRTMPTPESIIGNKLGLENILAVPVGSGCVGGLFALRDAYLQLRNDCIKEIESVYVVACGDRSSRVVDKKTSILFSEGVAALVLTNKPITNGYRIDELFLRSLNSSNTLGVLAMEIDNDSRVYKMDSGAVLDFVMNHAIPSIRNGLNLDSLKEDFYVIPHQASGKILRTVASALDIPKERVYTEDIEIGNFSVSSWPIALYHILEKRKVRNDQVIVPITFGAGNNCGGFIAYPVGEPFRIAL